MHINPFPRCHDALSHLQIGFLTQNSNNLFTQLLRLRGHGDSASPSTAYSERVVRSRVDAILKQLPPKYDMVVIEEKAKELLEDETQAPFVVVALHECKRMNALLTEVGRSLLELQMGLNGKLNISTRMDELAEAVNLDQVPGSNPLHRASWLTLSWASNKSLSAWVDDLIKRVQQLTSWVGTLALPKCLWLPGLFNPTAFLTAIMQVTARKTKMPLNQMVTETHVTTFATPEDARSAMIGGYGVLVHGLFLQGARWFSQENDQPVVVDGLPTAGVLSEATLQELFSPMPVLYIKAVPVQETWRAESVGYLRPDPGLYNCPVYSTTERGSRFLTVATLKTSAPAEKWIKAGVAIMMQTPD